MLEKANLKAFQLSQKMELEPAKEHCKKLLSLAHETLEAEPNAENSHAFNYWGDVMDELNEMVVSNYLLY